MKFCSLKCVLFAAGFFLVGAVTSSAQRRSGQETSAADKGGKPRIVVLGASSPDIGWTQNVTTASLEDALQQSGRFELITGTQRDKLLAEQGFNNSDMVDPKQATQVGRLLSARYIIIGNALEVSTTKKKVPHSPLGGLIPRTTIGSGDEISSEVRTKVQIQMLDAQTGVVKLSRSYDEKVSRDAMAHSSGDYDTLREGYRKAIEKVAGEFVHEFGLSVPTEATVVFIRGEKIALDIGSDQSARVGQEFEVVSQDEPIKNAAGEILSYVTTKYARLRIVSVEPKISWTTVVQTYDQDGNPDPQPRIERVKLNYTARQVQ
ncbi:MAG TPA: CsgG/HfaB family protein [Blastocatellia bacterium]|nr:CsgG/HfaB family protein [Blastocatellia bacterium]